MALAVDALLLMGGDYYYYYYCDYLCEITPRRGRDYVGPLYLCYKEVSCSRP